jgi:adenylate cyclase
MARQTHYEIHVEQKGRWTIHARYTARQKDEALDEARELDAMGHIDTVKVIREVFNDETGGSEEYTIYKTGSATGDRARDEAMKQVSSHSNDDESDDGWDDDIDDIDPMMPAEGQRKKKAKAGKKGTTTLTGVIVKILLVIMFSISIAALLTASSSVWIDGLNVFGTRLVGAAKSNALFGIFFGSFTLISIMMSTIFFRGDSLKTRERRKRPQQPVRQAAPPTPKKKKQKSGISLASAAEELRRAVADEDDSYSDIDDDLEHLNAKGVVIDTDDAAGSEPSSTMSPQAEKQKQFMMGFLHDALSGVGDTKKLDNFNKFGVNLFLAGACESLAQKRGLEGQDHAKILADSVRSMGFKKSHAATFADRYDEYLMQDARYMQMFQAGRNAMNTHFHDPGDASKNLKGAIDEWNKPKAKEENTGTIAVLFTDIAGSTAMTQQLGDSGAQQVVRAHNKVVREALSANAGREVKHTGDGIMASFNKTADAVAAAIQMQKGSMAVRKGTKLPLHLKIGINAGEPIQEDNDLFGTTVQMSARIVDKAQADEIFCSEIVRGICTGKGVQFLDRGTYAMKGFDQDPTLWEVKWWQGSQSPKLKTKAKTAAAAKPAAAPGAPPAPDQAAARKAAVTEKAGIKNPRGVRLIQAPAAQ